MTQAQQRIYQAMRNCGWNGVRIPTGPDQPRGGPMIMVNGRADVVYILPGGHILLLKDTVQSASAVISRDRGPPYDFPLTVRFYNIDRLAALLEVVKSEPPYRV